MSLALAVSLSAGGLPVLHPVTLELPPVRPNVLLGSTGAGKTTLLRLMAGLAGRAPGASWPKGATSRG